MPIAWYPSSNSVVRPPAQKKKKTMAHPIQKGRTPPPVSPYSLSASSSSSSSRDKPEAGVMQPVPPIICEEEEEEGDMASNLRTRFHKRHRKRLSESITVHPSLSKKACLEPTPNPPSKSTLSTTTIAVTSEPNKKSPSIGCWIWSIILLSQCITTSHHLNSKGCMDECWISWPPLPWCQINWNETNHKIRMILNNFCCYSCVVSLGKVTRITHFCNKQQAPITRQTLRTLQE